MTLSAEDTERLTKLLGLLSSDHAGERATAGAMADKLLRKNDMTWADFFARPQAPEPRTIAEQCDVCLACPAINNWERKFLRSIRGESGLSTKQLAKLNDILAKVRAFRAATGAER